MRAKMLLRFGAHQGSGEVDACGAGVGAIKPRRLGETEQAVVVVHFEAQYYV